MIRFLPIFLLVIGLVLTLSSLARAEAMQPASLVSSGDSVCLETIEQSASIDRPERKSVKCWKTLKTGLIVLPCPPDPSLASVAVGSTRQPAGFSCGDIGPLKVSEGEPFLDLPPPRA